METFPLFPLRRLLSFAFSLILLVTSVAVAVPVSASINHDHDNTAELDAAYGTLIKTSIQGECDYKAAFEVLDIVNKERKKAKLSPLSMDEELLEAAMLRAAECAIYYSHNRPSGDRCFTVLDRVTSAGENIAAGYTSASKVMQAWMSSEGHKFNIMASDFRSIGVGVFKIDGIYYWSQYFNGVKQQKAPTQKKATTKTLPIEARTALLDLNINHTSLSLGSGETATIKVENRNKTFYNMAHQIDPSGLSFVPTTYGVVTVSKTGKITPVGKGSTSITVKSQNGVKLFTVSVKTTCDTVHTHKYSAATCTAAKTCKECGATSGKALGHTYSNDCDASCNRCKATRSISHTYKKVITKATLTKDGSIKNVCSKCGYASSKTTVIYKASKISLSTTTYTYNGKTQKPSVVVKDSKGKTISSSHYTVTYASGRKNVGTYKVTVKMKGNYSGTKTLAFKVLPAKTTVKATAATKSLKLTIAKKTTQVTGYEVQYSTAKTFKSYKSKILTSSSKTSLTLTGLKAKTAYYVRVRTYKTVNDTKVYSGWSTIVSKKTK